MPYFTIDDIIKLPLGYELFLATQNNTQVCNKYVPTYLVAHTSDYGVYFGSRITKAGISKIMERKDFDLEIIGNMMINAFNGEHIIMFERYHLPLAQSSKPDFSVFGIKVDKFSKHFINWAFDWTFLH